MPGIESPCLSPEESHPSPGAERACLVIIDLIRDLVLEGSPMAGSASHAAHRGTLRAANTAADFARAHDWPLIFVRVAFSPDYHDAPAASPIFQRARNLGALQEGSEGVQWHPDLRVDPGEIVLTKKGISAFCGTNLEEILRQQECWTLVVAGVSSPMAVEATIRTAHDLGLATVMLEDACAAADDVAHRQAMRICGMLGSVLTVSELMH